jgi:hypothetical protein
MHHFILPVIANHAAITHHFGMRAREAECLATT